MSLAPLVSRLGLRLCGITVAPRRNRRPDAGPGAQMASDSTQVPPARRYVVPGGGGAWVNSCSRDSGTGRSVRSWQRLSADHRAQRRPSHRHSIVSVGRSRRGDSVRLDPIRLRTSAPGSSVGCPVPADAHACTAREIHPTRPVSRQIRVPGWPAELVRQTVRMLFHWCVCPLGSPGIAPSSREEQPPARGASVRRHAAAEDPNVCADPPSHCGGNSAQTSRTSAEVPTAARSAARPAHPHLG